MAAETEIDEWRSQERDALLRHASNAAAQAAKANGQGREGADSAAEFVIFILKQAFAARDAELARAAGATGVRTANSAMPDVKER